MNNKKIFYYKVNYMDWELRLKNNNKLHKV